MTEITEGNVKEALTVEKRRALFGGKKKFINQGQADRQKREAAREEAKKTKGILSRLLNYPKQLSKTLFEYSDHSRYSWSGTELVNVSGKHRENGWLKAYRKGCKPRPLNRRQRRAFLQGEYHGR